MGPQQDNSGKQGQQLGRLMALITHAAKREWMPLEGASAGWSPWWVRLGQIGLLVQGAGRSAEATIVMAWLRAVRAQPGPRVDILCAEQ